ncbi:MAG: hypothetical protein Wins2KO_28380 [Winogradskyella sp.]
MKYYSYLDNHNLTLDELQHLSSEKLKEVFDHLNQTDHKLKSSLVSGLEDPTLRSYHITVEKNTWLKSILFKKYENLTDVNFDLDLSSLDYVGGFKLFLEPYLLTHLNHIVDHFFKTNNLDPLKKIFQHSDLFSNACISEISIKLSQKVSIGIEALSSNEDFKTNETIIYLTNKDFYGILELFDSQLKDQINELRHSIATCSKDSKMDSNGEYHSFITQVQIASNNRKTEDTIIKESEIDFNDIQKAIEEVTTPIEASYQDKQTKSNKNQNIYIISGILTVLVCAVFYFLPTNDNDSEQKSTSTSQNKKRSSKYDNRIRFYYSLKRKSKKTNSIPTENLAYDEVYPFSNPYPKTFDNLSNNNTSSRKHKVKISNSSNQDLIVFKLIKGKDKSLFIPKNESIFINLKSSDSILFYTGNGFQFSKFSHFTSDPLISEIYKVETINETRNPEISISAVNSQLSLKQKSIPDKNIQTNNTIKLRKLNLDGLYKDYYNKLRN